MTQPILITGAAGFIGFHLAKLLLMKGMPVIGFDNMNDYYDVSLKEARLSLLNEYEGFAFVRGDLADKAAVFALFSKYHPVVVVHLAAQAGVRYSIDCPDVYISANITGFFHILEACRYHPVKHLIYASSSSVYGGNEKVPFSTSDNVDQPISLYAATKKSNELMARAYSHLYQIPATGLRFFTVYGPYGRPDMACFKFSDLIMGGKPIEIYNHGDMYRDFTYIDDIIGGIERMLSSPPCDDSGTQHKVYNIGNNKPEHLLRFIELLEEKLGVKATKEFLPMQAGDVQRTYADIDDLVADFDFKPQISIEEGLDRFVKWYREYYKW
ncbi:MAG: GDP-mannose 4,6-dehydratase [Lachnospiraceae bacterium]|jgi:UDP-glucuronate 4-epimerase|nr:GDP-mannose 4,6-dehydratase [Lachnospiraceae bacterium]